MEKETNSNELELWHGTREHGGTHAHENGLYMCMFVRIISSTMCLWSQQLRGLVWYACTLCVCLSIWTEQIREWSENLEEEDERRGGERKKRKRGRDGGRKRDQGWDEEGKSQSFKMTEMVATCIDYSAHLWISGIFQCVPMLFCSVYFEYYDDKSLLLASVRLAPNIPDHTTGRSGECMSVWVKWYGRSACIRDKQ